MTTQRETGPSTVQAALTDILTAAAGIPTPVVSESPEESLAQLGLDSLAAMQLQAGVKDRFGVLIPDDSFEMSFGEITRYVIARLGSDG